MNLTIIFVVLTAAALLIFLGVKITLKFRKKLLLGVTIPVAMLYVLLAVWWQPDNLLISNSIVVITAVLAGSLLGLLLSSEPSIISFSIAAAAGTYCGTAFWGDICDSFYCPECDALYCL